MEELSDDVLGDDFYVPDSTDLRVEDIVGADSSLWKEKNMQHTEMVEKFSEMKRKAEKYKKCM